MTSAPKELLPAPTVRTPAIARPGTPWRRRDVYSIDLGRRGMHLGLSIVVAVEQTGVMTEHGPVYDFATMDLVESTGCESDLDSEGEPERLYDLFDVVDVCPFGSEEGPLPSEPIGSSAGVGAGVTERNRSA